MVKSIGNLTSFLALNQSHLEYYCSKKYYVDKKQLLLPLRYDTTTYISKSIVFELRIRKEPGRVHFK